MVKEVETRAGEAVVEEVEGRDQTVKPDLTVLHSQLPPDHLPTTSAVAASPVNLRLETPQKMEESSARGLLSASKT